MRRRITDGTGNSACAERSTRSPSHSSTNTVFLNVMTIARATLTVPSGSYVWFSNKTLPLSAITRHLLSCWFSGARGENRTHEYRICSPVPLPLGDARELERKERFELSSRVWKTRMFPATSLPRMSCHKKAQKEKVLLLLRLFVAWFFYGRGGQNRTVATSSQDSDACVTPHPGGKGLSLDADYLLDLGDNFDQVFLVLHHRLDRLVSAWNLVQYADVFATFNTRSLALKIVFREMTLGLSSGHLATRTVRAGIETLRQAASLNDERLRAHRSGNDAVHVSAGVDCALAGDENFLAVVFFERNVVVVTVDRQLRLEGLSMIEHLVKDFQ